MACCDKNGAELCVGDEVNLKCVVRNVNHNPGHCDCTLETCEPLGAHRPTVFPASGLQVEKCCAPCAVGALPVGFSFDDAKALALKVVGHLERNGDAYLDEARGIIRLAGYVYQRQFVLALVEINSDVTNAQKLIAAIKSDFGI